jgi:hypothetical protein
MHAIPASVAQVNRQMSPQNIPIFCSPNTPFYIIISVCVWDSFLRKQPSIVRATLCTSAPQGAHHFCVPSDLLITTTTTCFSELIAYISECSSRGQNLIQFANHCCPTASTVCVKCTFAEPENSLPKSAHQHHDWLKHCIHNFKHQHWDFALLQGGVANLGHMFKIHSSPDHSF